jgi:hypothetical protein
MRCKPPHFLLIFVLMAGCRHQPKPYQIILAGYTVRFPITSSELKREYPMADTLRASTLYDTTTRSSITWRFDDMGSASAGLRGPKNQSYGVLIKIKDGWQKIDSIRAGFEQLYHKSFVPLTPTHLSKYEWVSMGKEDKIAVMDINEDVQLSIRRDYTRPPINPHGNTYSQLTNDVIISICYNLDGTQREHFALREGEIHPDD